MQWFYRILPLPWKQGTKRMNRQQEKKLMPFKNTIHFEKNIKIRVIHLKCLITKIHHYVPQIPPPLRNSILFLKSGNCKKLNKRGCLILSMLLKLRQPYIN